MGPGLLFLCNRFEREEEHSLYVIDKLPSSIVRMIIEKMTCNKSLAATNLTYADNDFDAKSDALDQTEHEIEDQLAAFEQYSSLIEIVEHSLVLFWLYLTPFADSDARQAATFYRHTRRPGP